MGLLTTLMVSASAASADDTDKYKPGGIGDMMPSPVTPKGQGTLFEMYEPDVYKLDKQLSDDLTGGDLMDGGLHAVASFLMEALLAIGRASVTITQWCFNVVSLPEIEPALSKAIGAAATPMATAILPSAIAVGMFIAWAKRAEQSVLGQMAWVAASAAIACTFFAAPNTWVKGVDEARQLGSGIALTTIDGGIAGDNANAMPFKTPTPAWSGKARDDSIRKASDGVWRTYVVVPWCTANFGSLEACKRWGPDTLDKGTDMDAREEYLKVEMNTKNAGGEAVEWRQGHTPSGRIGVLLAGVVTAVIFSALVVVLAATSLASLLGALMLLVCGVAFASLWCIPGRPRQWGVSWLEALIGMIVVSLTSTMLLGSVMILNVAMMSLHATFGWLMTSLLNIAAAGMAFKLKGKLDGIVSAGGAQLAGRGVLNTVGHLAGRRHLANALGGNQSAQRTGSGGIVGRIRNRNRGNPAGSSGGRGPSDGSPAGSTSGAGGYSVRVERARTYPAPPSYPQVGAGSYGNHAATRPGLPGGPGGPPARDTPPALPGKPSGPGSGGAGASPAIGAATGARTAKADLARHKASTAAAGGYPVRPGPPERKGVPHHPRQNGEKVVQGKVVSSPSSSGAAFRSFPPPAPRQDTPRPPQSGPDAPRVIRGEVVQRRQLPPGPRRRDS